MPSPAKKARMSGAEESGTPRRMSASAAASSPAPAVPPGEAIKVLVQEGRAQLHVKDNVSNLNMFFLILSSFPQEREAATGLG